MSIFKLKQCIEIYIINECNLTCSNCNRFNNYDFRGYYNWKDSEEAIIAWSKRITAPRITLIGGEPTMHPHLAEWMKGVTAAWPDVPVMIQTNGTNQIRGEKELEWRTPNTGFGVAIHKENMANKLTSYWGERSMFDATEFSECALVEQDSKFKVHDSDPVEAFNCCTMKYSHTIFQGNLYKCPMVAVLPEFRKQYQVDLLPHQEELLNNYKYLSPDCSDEELAKFVENVEHEIPQCNLCPGQYVTSIVTFDPKRKQWPRLQ